MHPPFEKFGLIPAKAPGRFDGDKVVEVEFVDGLQCLRGGGFLQIVGQSLEPRPIFGLKGEQRGDGVMPALGAASVVGGSPVMDHWSDRGAGGAMPGLSLGIGHRFVAKGRAGHGSTPKRYVTEP